MSKPNVFIARLTYGGTERAEVGNWLVRTVLDATRDDRLGEIHQAAIDKAPVYAARNFAVELARVKQCQYLVMIDADTVADPEPDKPTFWETAFDHAMTYGAPCAVVAPIRAIDGSVCIHKLVQNGDGDHLVRMTPEETAMRSGIERVVGSGLGLVLIDMRVFDALKPPYFRFAYSDPHYHTVAAGEDIQFTADLGGPGIPIFAAWNCWAAHAKTVLIGRPQVKQRIWTA